MLLSTHIIEDVQSVCSRLLVLHQGGCASTARRRRLIRAAEGHVGTFEGGAGGGRGGTACTSPPG